MDEYVIRAMARWPEIPAVYGWLSLDRRGDWRIKGERIGHRNVVAFINRNYGEDGAGCWYFQNGPQRVYVQLDYTPWVYRLTSDGRLSTHTAESVAKVEDVYLDNDGSVLLKTEKGIGVMDDRDLDALSDRFASSDGCTDAGRIEAAVSEVHAGRLSNLTFRWRGETLVVGHVPRASVASRFGFNPNPDGGEKKL